jgi:hypothetical protein
MLQSIVAHWNKAVGGLFTNVARWSSGEVPDQNTQAFLDAAGRNFTVKSLQDETVEFLALSSNATLDDEAGAFTINNAVDNAGKIDIDGGATLAFGLTTDGADQLFNSGAINIDSSTGPASLEFNAPQTQLRGGGEIALSGDAEITGGSASNNAQLENLDNTISGSGAIGGQFLRFENATGGTVDANSGAALTLNAEGGGNVGVLQNQASYLASRFAAGMLNLGTIETTGAGGLNIDSSMQQNGNLIADGTGALTINRARVVGSGNDSVVVKGASILLSNGALETSGIISTVAHSAIKTAAGTTDAIDAFDVENAGDIVVADGSKLFLAGQVDNSGAIDLNGATAATKLVVRAESGYAKVNGFATLRRAPPTPNSELDLLGTGTLTLSDSADNFIRSDRDVEFLVNSSAIAGSGTIGDRNLIFDNTVGGVVDSDGNAGMNIVGDRFHNDSADANSGQIETTGMGGLTLTRVLINSGVLKAAGAGALTLNDATVNNDGGIVQTTHKDASIVFDNGSITGGEVSIAAGSALNVSANALDHLQASVSNQGTINIGADATLFASGHWTNAGVINVNEELGGSLVFYTSSNQAFELDGGGTINLGGGQFAPGVFDANSSTTVVENVNNKIIGSGSIGDSGGFLVLQNDVGGLIDATGSGGLSIWSGNDIENAGTIQSDSSGGITINNTNGSGLDNGGHLIANAGVIDVQGDAEGPGIAQINDSAAIEFGSSSDLNVLFGQKAEGTLVLDTSTSDGAYTGEISGFTSKDQIDLTDLVFSSPPTLTYNGDAFGGTLSVTNGTLSTSLHMIGDYAQSSFTLSADKNGNTLIT